MSYRCRPAYKLLELDDKFMIFGKNSRTVVDLAAAPGGFSQVALERMHSSHKTSVGHFSAPVVLAFDTRPLEPLQGLHAVLCDINDHKRIVGHVKEFLSDKKHFAGCGDYRHVDVVLHDGVSVGKSQSAYSVTYAQNQMALGALRLASELFSLTPQRLGIQRPPRAVAGESVLSKSTNTQHGVFVTKLMHSSHFNTVLSAVKAHFRFVAVHKPAECAADSNETYVVARGPSPRGKRWRNSLAADKHFSLLSLPPCSDDVLPGRQIVWRCWGCLSYCMGTSPCANCGHGR
uniref:Uncharacterized protein TCIL3000_4_3580 n=1 Tax=Trypanosoma congolense (strain IL3000) TaxID=1068625 RepID=G0ULK1_TRYCI|nr:unnamed protein product [Trypanosoma congolense IL3000]